MKQSRNVIEEKVRELEGYASCLNYTALYKLTFIQEYEAVMNCAVLHHDRDHVAVIRQLVTLDLTHLNGLQFQFAAL